MVTLLRKLRRKLAMKAKKKNGRESHGSTVKFSERSEDVKESDETGRIDIINEENIDAKIVEQDENDIIAKFSEKSE